MTDTKEADADATLGLPIEDLGLSNGARNALRRSGINTVGDLVSHTDRDLRDLKHFGTVRLNEVQAALDELGLDLAPVPSPPPRIHPVPEPSAPGVLIEDLGLSSRARNSLRRSGLTTIADLTSLTAEGLRDIKNFGGAHLDEVQAALLGRGLTLAPPVVAAAPPVVEQPPTVAEVVDVPAPKGKRQRTLEVVEELDLDADRLLGYAGVAALVREITGTPMHTNTIRSYRRRGRLPVADVQTGGHEPRRRTRTLDDGSTEEEIETIPCWPGVRLPLPGEKIGCTNYLWKRSTIREWQAHRPGRKTAEGVARGAADRDLRFPPGVKSSWWKYEDRRPPTEEELAQQAKDRRNAARRERRAKVKAMQ